MILLVPVTPEVPSAHRPGLWQGLVLILIMGILFLETEPVIRSDSVYIDSLQKFVFSDENGQPALKPEAQSYLKLRPLLKIAPSRGDWSLPRLIFANFLHAGPMHLLLNLIGVFAGARLCATFIPFFCTVSIFIIGGSLGLLASMLLSPEVSQYVPHIGASAGIFAMMGTYYVYNFRYRTKYFFWYPSRRGLIALRTSWAVFFDVILLELVLSAAQLFPSRPDSVDHVAHVVGFAAGMALAYLLRISQRWPSYLQTRGEFLYWTQINRMRGGPARTSFAKWSELLEVNGYNDRLKLRLFQVVRSQSGQLTDAQIDYAFKFLTPTFVRLHTPAVGECLQQLLLKERKIPESWLARMPYDSIIRIARALAEPPEMQPLLFKLVSAYRKAHPEGGDLERKLELLMRKLSGFIPRQATPSPPAEQTTRGRSTR